MGCTISLRKSASVLRFVPADEHDKKNNKVVKSIEVYGDMHRWIPILVKQSGFKRIGEKVVKHQERKYGKSKFGMSRFINGFL